MIVSEILLFFSFFWTFFNFLKTINIPFLIEPEGLPLLKTFLLLSRGVSVTLFHRFLFRGQRGLLYLIYTLFLGIFFELCQINEYSSRELSLGSFTYGSVFFMLTGLHGFHVFVGLLFLSILFYFTSCSYVNSFSLIRTECLI
jgi:cytochrome c oxidase subunit 3